VTDANGMATVTINSDNKGWQFVYAVADYPGNPQSTGASNAGTPLAWGQLKWDWTAKIWTSNASSISRPTRSSA